MILIFVWVGVSKSVKRDSPDYSVSADQLYNEYKSNEVAADSKYKGKIVVVSGVIQDIGKDIIAQPYIVIGGMGFLDGVQCMFTGSENASVARLYKGQSVKVKGEVVGKMGNVLLNRCSLQVVAKVTVDSDKGEYSDKGKRDEAISDLNKAAAESRESALCLDLQTMNSQIELYKVQHEGRLPGAGTATFWEAMTGQTNINGGIGSDYGPYVQKILTNPFNDLNTVDVSGTGILGDDSHGWDFNPTTGAFRADNSGTPSDAKIEQAEVELEAEPELGTIASKNRVKEAEVYLTQGVAYFKKGE